MKRLGAGQIALLAIAVMLVGGRATADPRDIAEPPEPPTPEMKEARRVQVAVDMDVWLRRLEGRFRIEGVSYVDGQEQDSKVARGMEDCIGIGPGAGMQCVINVLWDEEWGADGQVAEAGVSSLAPAMIEYGLDPVASRIRSLQVDNQSLAEPGEGTLKGDTLKSSTRCANTPASALCQRVTRIYAPAEGSSIQLTIDVERNYDRVSTLMLSLRRISPGEEGATAGANFPQRPADRSESRPRSSTSRPAPGLPGGGGGRSGGGGSRR